MTRGHLLAAAQKGTTMNHRYVESAGLGALVDEAGDRSLQRMSLHLEAVRQLMAVK